MAAGKDMEGGRRGSATGWHHAAAALTMAAAGCSSGGDSGTAAETKAPSSGSSASAGGDSSPAVDEAKKIVAEWSAANSEWQGPTSAPAPKPGMRVALITCDQNAEGCARPARAQEVAAKLIGWKTTLFDGQGNPAKQLQAINAAIDAKFDAIVLDLVDTRVTQEGIQRAIKAGIPMVSVANLSNEPSSIPDVSHDWVYAGELAAYYMIAQSEGKVNALVLLDNEFEVVKNGEYKGIMSVLEDKTKCPECKVTVKEFQIANLETQPGNHAVAALQQDPSINWVWCFDACMARAATQVLASGISTEAKGIGMNANAQNLQLIRDDQFQTHDHRQPLRVGGLGGARQPQPAAQRPGGRGPEDPGPDHRQEQPRRAQRRRAQGRLGRRHRLRRQVQGAVGRQVVGPHRWCRRSCEGL